MARGMEEVAELLERHYRHLAIPEVEGTWEQACLILLNHGTKQDRVKSGMLRNTLLEFPADVESASLAELAEAVEQFKAPEKIAATLKKLAPWWSENISPDDGADGHSTEELQQQLMALPGINRELADRLLLLVFGRAVVPLERGLLRIGVRHGWLDTSADYEEWQSFFVRGCENAGVELIPLLTHLRQVGKEFCGPQPKCTACPLQTLLPPSGPYELDG
ncbi:MAG: hypothetical protein U0903_19080 [Planctomycetales bacterium]